MSLYKVVKEEGVVVDDVEFAKDEILDLDPEAFNVSEFLAEGSIVAEVSEEDEADTEIPEDESTKIPTHDDGTHMPE